MAGADRVKNEARIAERRPAMAPSTMRADGAMPVDVMVIDVSATGVRISTAFELDVGQEISIGLAGAGSTRAFVAWKRDNEYGCKFERPLEAEGEARAFSRSPVVHLGRVAPVKQQGGHDDLRELWQQHRPWKIPLDAVFVFIVELGLAAAGLWWLFGR
ncbi:PilZ domain-containing protein [Sphingomonas sp. MMS24-J13]|uniref:PilZ domain-containing protein n=1 Tax=Sphingomonas sp. MMS24-J13 TaxID=3238686 RepID=UPI00384C3F5C